MRVAAEMEAAYAVETAGGAVQIPVHVDVGNDGIRHGGGFTVAPVNGKAREWTPRRFDSRAQSG